jgi:nicotinamide riboside transporter PnuC
MADVKPYLDWTAALISVIAVYCLIRKSAWYWALGLVTNSLQGILYFGAGLLMAGGLQIAYLLFSVYALFRWLAESRHGKLSAAWQDVGTLISVGILLSYAMNSRFDSPYAFLEFAAVSLFITANWMAANKWRANWLVWIVANGLFATVLWHKQIYGLFCAQFVFIVMCVWGYRQWGREN